jgi:DNA-binding IclR family transcriptional regulator
MTAGKPVGAVVAAVRILRHLAESSEPLSSNRIARELSINPSTCFNILKTLEHEGLVYCDPDSKRHRPGLVLLELAGGAMDQLGYKQMLHPHLERIARDHHLVATLWVRSGYDRVVLVDAADGGGLVKIVMPIGQRVPLLAGALGRCFAGYNGFTRQELRKLFQRVRWHDAPSFETFMEQAAEAARRGYAIDAGNFAGGVTTISSPILDREGRPIMALSAVTFSTAMDQAEIVATGEDLARAAGIAARTMVGIPELATAGVG